MSDVSPALSVVVMGYRNAATIVAAVASVVRQDADGPFEVVVVTSGGDESGALVRRTFPQVVVVDAPTRLLPGGARNVGVARTSGEIVAFLAADCTAERGWVAARLRAHRAGHRVVASAVTVGEPRTPAAWALHFDLFGTRLTGRAAGPVEAGDPAAHGCSFDRALLDEIGPFADDVLVGEDTLAVERIRALGVPVWFEPTIRTAHRGPRRLRQLLDERYRRGVAAVEAAVPTPDPITLGRALAAAPVRYVRGLGRTLAVCWRDGRNERTRLAAALPWLLAGRAAGTAGWYRARLRRGS